MKIKTKVYNKHTLLVSEEELDWLQLTVACFLENKLTHESWRPRLSPILEQMRDALEHGNEYEEL